jgi:hypothetical protein
VAGPPPAVAGRIWRRRLSTPIAVAGTAAGVVLISVWRPLWVLGAGLCVLFAAKPRLLLAPVVVIPLALLGGLCLLPLALDWVAPIGGTR